MRVCLRGPDGQPDVVMEVPELQPTFKKPEKWKPTVKIGGLTDPSLSLRIYTCHIVLPEVVTAEGAYLYVCEE
jgi:hypothetical protein